MTLSTDIPDQNFSLDFLPVETRVPLKFGSEVLSSVTCVRVKVNVEKMDGKKAEGFGETPLSVQWVWPSDTLYSVRFQALVDFCKLLAERWEDFVPIGHCD